MSWLTRYPATSPDDTPRFDALFCHLQCIGTCRPPAAALPNRGLPRGSRVQLPSQSDHFRRTSRGLCRTPRPRRSCHRLSGFRSEPERSRRCLGRGRFWLREPRPSPAASDRPSGSACRPRAKSARATDPGSYPFLRKLQRLAYRRPSLRPAGRARQARA